MLSSQDDPKEIPEWIELDYFDRPRPLARRRKYLLWASWLGGAVLGCALVAMPFTRLPQPRAAYAAGPVSSSHAMFANDCGRCHTEGGQTWARFWAHDDTHRSVPDRACLTCHDGPIHNERQPTAPGCAVCHREHRGRAALAHVADEHCTACHAALKPKEGEPHFFPEITAFPGGHPEFGRWRRAPLTDPGTLQFNHRAHLRKGLPVPGGQTVDLDCTACHRADAAGRYMLPIRYEEHCARCHPLNVQALGEWPVPHPRRHQTAAQVRDALRGQLLASTPAAGLQRQQKPDEPALAPLGARRGPPMTETELGGVNRQLREAERVLFDLSGGCAFCHRELTHPEQRPAGLPQYAPPAVTVRWFPHSRFDHAAHRMLECVACHEGATCSTATSDVLLPKRAACAKCHSPAGGARADCAECHAYHDHRKDRSLNGRLPIRGLTGGNAGRPGDVPAPAGP